MRDVLKINGEAQDVSVALKGDGCATVRIGEAEYAVEQVRRDGAVLRFTLDGQRLSFLTHSTPRDVQVTNGVQYHKLARVEEGVAEEDDGADELISKMPGTVLKLLVEVGAEVSKGTPLLILEAMKMEHEVCAPEDGSVTGFPHPEGERVMPGDLLAEFDPTGLI